MVDVRQTARMKLDWNERARENARWFINTVALDQSEEAFAAGGQVEVAELVVSDLAALTRGRPARELRLLEIGCGLGRMTRPLAALFGEVWATDVSGEMLAGARRRLTDETNVRLIETSGTDFGDLPSDSVDVIFSAYVFQHVPTAEIVRANLEEAWRLLRPGGVIKFQTNGVDSAEYDAVAKDTWAGTGFGEIDLLRLARRLGARVPRLVGAGTQYCWTWFEKPTSPGARVTPRIGSVLRGEDGLVTIEVSGLDPDRADVGSVIVSLGRRELRPLEVSGRGPVVVRCPVGAAGGLTAVRVRSLDGPDSDPVLLDLPPPEPPRPVIALVQNHIDGGTDIHASGPKSAVLVRVLDLDRETLASDVRLEVNERLVVPALMVFLPGNGLHALYAQLPDGLPSGEARFRVRAGARESGVVRVQLR